MKSNKPKKVGNNINFFSDWSKVICEMDISTTKGASKLFLEKSSEKFGKRKRFKDQD